MVNKKILLWFALLPLSFAATVVHAADDRATVAITADGAPLIELYRNRDGSLRYEINDDLALGMSLGLVPVRLTRAPGSASFNARWLPLFDLYREDTRVAYLLPEQSVREARSRKWFWSVGTHSGFGDTFDFESDLAQNFSLQTKTGFLIPLGRRWILGGALTLDHVIAADSAAGGSAPNEGTSLGAFLGIEFSY